MGLKNIKTSINTMKKKVSITIEENLLKEIDILANTVDFSSRSHVIEVAVSRFLNKIKEK